MENFDEVMKKIAVKVENKYGIAYYELKELRRVRNIDVREYEEPKKYYYTPVARQNKVLKPTKHIAFNARAVITPLGRFESFKLAAHAHNLTEQALRNRFKRDTKGDYKYEEDTHSKETEV